MEKIIMSIGEVGLKYGTKGIVNCIQQGKNLSKTQTESLFKEVQRHYQNVLIEGKGKKRMFILADSYEVAQEKQDARKNNGTTFPFINIVKELIIHYLKDNECFAENEFYAITYFLQKLEMIDPKFRRARMSEKDLLCYKKQLIRDEVLTETNAEFAKYYINNEHRSLSAIVKKALRELEHEGLILTNEITQGFGYKTVYNLNDMGQIEMINGKPIVEVVPHHFVLTQEQLKKIIEIDNELMRKFQVSRKETFLYKNSKKVRQYNAAKKEAFEEFGIEYYYPAITAYIITSDDEIAEYLKREKEIVIWDFMSEYKKYSLGKAEEREAKTLSKSFGITDDSYIIQMRQKQEYANTWDDLQDSLLQGIGLKNYEELEEKERIELGLKKIDDEDTMPDF